MVVVYTLDFKSVIEGAGGALSVEITVALTRVSATPDLKPLEYQFSTLLLTLRLDKAAAVRAHHQQALARNNGQLGGRQRAGQVVAE